MRVIDKIEKDHRMSKVTFQVFGNFELVKHENNAFAIHDVTANTMIRIYNDMDHNYIVFMLDRPEYQSSRVYKFVNMSVTASFYTAEPVNPKTMYNPVCVERYSEKTFLEIVTDWHNCKDIAEKDDLMNMLSLLDKHHRIMVDDPTMEAKLEDDECCDECEHCNCECCDCDDEDEDEFDDPITGLEEDMNEPRYSANDVMKMIENMHKNREVY